MTGDALNHLSCSAESRLVERSYASSDDGCIRRLLQTAQNSSISWAKPFSVHCIVPLDSSCHSTTFCQRSLRAKPLYRPRETFPLCRFVGSELRCGTFKTLPHSPPLCVPFRVLQMELSDILQVICLIAYFLLDVGARQPDQIGVFHQPPLPIGCVRNGWHAGQFRQQRDDPDEGLFRHHESVRCQAVRPSTECPIGRSEPGAVPYKNAAPQTDRGGLMLGGDDNTDQQSSTMYKGDIFDTGFKDYANKPCDHINQHDCRNTCDSKRSLCDTCARKVAAGKPCT
ncbi:hypothetical protein NLU13_6039 [Sarocladium strictum]|uniref:Uncharacterized protein n=1 Tax=Sarocladium strictum TaxID=5046 RepID=A0AA39GHI6_SARSR|nr:hypothetical protein NLU13_6039 [Sarocladium strictum]